MASRTPNPRTFESELAALREADLLRELHPFDGRSGASMRAGRLVLTNFSSNDYLGMAVRPEVAQLLAEMVEQFGAGAGASRLISGTLRPHADLEEMLAGFHGTEAALTFSSGYTAAVGLLSGLLRRGDVVILDRLAHASLIDGARLSGATMRTFAHNDLDQLERRLVWARGAAPAEGRVLVVTEAVFSMDGDQAPLREISGMATKHGALLLVDEAHSFGLFGRGGRGLLDELGLGATVDFHLGTLSKAVGLAGGYVAGSATGIELLVNRARSFVYSTAPPPALAATAARVLRELVAGPVGDTARRTLWAHVRRLSAALGMSEPRSAIVPLIIGPEALALKVAATLRERGFLIPAVRYPSVARQRARLRITLSASHTDDDVDRLIGTLHDCGIREPLAP